DLGGVDPGGWAIHARDLFDESVTIPPIKIVEAGVVRWELAEAYVRQSREPDAILLNVKSAVAGINRIRGELEAPLDELGPAGLRDAQRRALARRVLWPPEHVLHARPRRARDEQDASRRAARAARPRERARRRGDAARRRRLRAERAGDARRDAGLRGPGAPR